MKLQYWNNLSKESMTFENVKRIYSFSHKKYRIQEDTYDNSDTSTGFWMSSFGLLVYYVKQGEASFMEESTGDKTLVSQGNVLQLSQGKYFFTLISDTPFDFIRVIEIPDGYS